jgi:hypothetical protein
LGRHILGATLRENWKWRAIAVGAAAVVALGACSGDDDDASGSEGTTTTASSEAPAADAAAFCNAISELGLAVSQGDADPPDVDVLVAAGRAAPEEIRADVTTMANEARAQVAAGAQPKDAPPVIPSDDFFKAATSVGDYMADNCGYQVIDVTATDYAYEGIPAHAKVGKTLLRITNNGNEYHELILQRVRYDETRSIKQILELPEKESGDLLDFKANTVAPPGLGNWTVVDLFPGRHAAMCFIPTGSTPEAMRNGQVNDTAPSHARKGMFAEMQVP